MSDASGAPRPAPDDDDRVPIFGTWSRIYGAVIVCTLLSMALIALFSRWRY
jgi:hypothetical protein